MASGISHSMLSQVCGEVLVLLLELQGPELRLRNEFPTSRQQCWEAEELRENAATGAEIRGPSGRLELSFRWDLPEEPVEETFDWGGKFPRLVPDNIPRSSDPAPSNMSKKARSKSVLRLEIPKKYWNLDTPFSLQLLLADGTRSRSLVLRGLR